MSVDIKSRREQRTAELGLIDSPVYPSLPVYTSRLISAGYDGTPPIYKARNCHKGNDIYLIIYSYIICTLCLLS